ncbi:hypothetical protein Xen7305DRAFT_00033930 [Xenococcus sp. PCC 7305]|uniref:hypothetical protein n=1 Tax=Xenococcus sp. PCC 7305 TaxID=102125 RepID=UPI0002ABE1B1|nr:hypothetical protein [Xenococcus sp. PCC 7305]ELS03669.1 hypothetical protein Xen7305DRAFT_00033930 [Xenococcus sp. PCC 7305]
MLREKLKQEIDKLSEEQLIKLSDFFAIIKLQSEENQQDNDLKQKISNEERAEEFQQWTMKLPKDINTPSLSDEAFSRENVYSY